MGMRIPFCDACNKDGPVMLMIVDEVWETIKPLQTRSGGILCASCIQKRLGRRLMLDDLKSRGDIFEFIRLGAAIASGNVDEVVSFGVR